MNELSKQLRLGSPVEVIIPYDLEPQGQSAVKAFAESRYKGPIFNMDFPWLVTMASSAAVMITWALLVAHTSRTFGLNPVLAVLSAFPIFFVLISPLIYPALESANLKLAYGKDWLRYLVGPTHIGLTDSGFKLYWRGRFFYNYPSLAIWPEIFDANLVEDPLYGGTSLQFVYQTGFGRRIMTLPVCGFSSREDLELVLESFARHIPEDNQSLTLKEQAGEGFARLLAEFDQTSALKSLPGTSERTDT
ncbi:MAG: hypothetical protein KC777_23185 [Cyanobacteria bacterium HKST-UBA02]|nr:hypothetical protein [Cyanobacteria bacterium HKST-UBA02]